MRARHGDGCNRNDETQACGDYLLVTGSLARPLAVVDNTAKLASVLSWNAFGIINRKALRGSESAHPYGQSAYTNLANIGAIPPTGTNSLAFRLQFDAVDTEGVAGSPVDFAEIKQGSSVVGRVGGAHRGKVWSSWTNSTSGYVAVTFQSNNRSCPPSGPCPTDGGVPDGGNWPYWGVALTGYEVKQWQPGAKEMTTPLRFPGQYFDQETDKHENWNRYYDPQTGRYLSPEPMLQSPTFTTSMAARGIQVPSYAYAANNPLRYVDPTGLWVSVDPQFQVAYDAMKVFLTPDELRQLTILENDPTKGVHITPRYSPGVAGYFSGTRGAFLWPRSKSKFACTDSSPHSGDPRDERELFINSMLLAEWYTKTGIFNSADIAIFHELFGHYFNPSFTEWQAAAASDGYTTRVYGGLHR